MTEKRESDAEHTLIEKVLKWFLLSFQLTVDFFGCNMSMVFVRLMNTLSFSLIRSNCLRMGVNEYIETHV